MPFPALPTVLLLIIVSFPLSVLRLFLSLLCQTWFFIMARLVKKSAQGGSLHLAL